MVASRKSRRYTRKAKGSRRTRHRKHRGGSSGASGKVTIYFQLAPGSGVVSNVFSSDPAFTVQANPPSKAGKINITGTSKSKIRNVEAKAIPDGSTTGWASGLMSPAVSNTTKFTLSRGTASLMGRTAVSIPAAGVTLADKLNINNLLGTSNWSAGKQPHSSGVAPPGGTAPANIQLILTTA